MLTATLKPKQKVGSEFIRRLFFGIIGFKTGVGKSVTVLSAILHWIDNSERYAVIFAPKNAIEKVWTEEISTHTTDKFIKIKDVYDTYQAVNNLSFLKKYKFILVRYSEVIKYKALIRAVSKGSICAFDECHKLKNPNAKMTSCLHNITMQAAVKWGLTATAILNSIMDLYFVTSFFSESVFGTEEDFKSMYTVRKEIVIGRRRDGRLKKALEIIDYKNLDKLKEITDRYLIKVEVDINVKFHDIKYDMSEHEERIYLQAAKGILQASEEDKRGFAQRLPDLQRACDGSKDIHGENVLGVYSNKYLAFQKEISRILCKDESIIMFVEYYDSFDYVESMLNMDFPNTPIFKICGRGVEMPDKYPCIVLATAGGSESLNLKFANHVMFYSIPFSVGAFIQTLGRITRTNSDYLEDLNAYIPKNDTNIDLYKYRLLVHNAGIINDILGKDANLPTEIAAVRKGLIAEMRKELLWRTKKLSA